MSAESPRGIRAASVWYTTRDDHIPRHPDAYPAQAIRLEGGLTVGRTRMTTGDYVLCTPHGLRLARRDMFMRAFRECTEQESAAAAALASAERGAILMEVEK